MGIEAFIESKNFKIEYEAERQRTCRSAYNLATTTIDSLAESEIDQENMHGKGEEGDNFYTCKTTPFVEIEGKHLALRSRLKDNNPHLCDVQVIARLTDDSEGVYATLGGFDISVIAYAADADRDMKTRGDVVAADQELTEVVQATCTALTDQTLAATAS